MSVEIRRTIYGVITEANLVQQIVETDEPGHLGFHCLRGPVRAKGGKVGDRVKLEYRVTPQWGLWFAEVVE